MSIEDVVKENYVKWEELRKDPNWREKVNSKKSDLKAPTVLKFSKAERFDG